MLTGIGILPGKRATQGLWISAFASSPLQTGIWIWHTIFQFFPGFLQWSSGSFVHRRKYPLAVTVSLHFAEMHLFVLWDDKTVRLVGRKTFLKDSKFLESWLSGREWFTWFPESIKMIRVAIWKIAWPFYFRLIFVFVISLWSPSFSSCSNCFIRNWNFSVFCS